MIRRQKIIIIGPNMKRSDKRKFEKIVSKAEKRQRISPEEAQRLRSLYGDDYLPKDQYWDTIRVDLPTLLIDERDDIGFGKKGRSSDTFTLASTYIPEPEPIREFFDELYPMSYEMRLAYEEKAKDMSFERKQEIIRQLMDNDAMFASIGIEKASPEVPERYSPKRPMPAYRNMAEDLIELSLSGIDAEKITLYFDDCSQLRNDAGVRRALEVAQRLGIKVIDVRQLRSGNEPMLRIQDVPTSAFGRYNEDGDRSLYDQMAPKRRELFYGRRYEDRRKRR